MPPQDYWETLLDVPRILDAFGFDYEFRSATECYRSGVFDDTLRLVLRLPGESEPIQSKARIMWQHQAGDGLPRFHSGCQLLELPDTVRSRNTQHLEQAKTT